MDIRQFSIQDYSDYKPIYGDEPKTILNSLLLEAVTKSFQAGLDKKIIVPTETGKNKKLLTENWGKILPEIERKLYETVKPLANTLSYFSSLIKRPFDVYKPDETNILRDFDDISYFGQYITSDSLDSVITEIPIEVQLLKEEKCDELENSIKNIMDILKNFKETGTQLGKSIENKKMLVDNLQQVISRQQDILNGKQGVEMRENIQLDIMRKTKQHIL